MNQNKSNFVTKEIPDSLDEWDSKTIDQIISFSSIESETLEIKESLTDLTRHICAMANTSGGIIILGIKEEKDADKKITGFTKTGFEKGREDEIGLAIGENIFSISPTVSYKIKHIPENSVFYSVLKIKNETSKKPFFIKNKGQCFVRIDNSSRPAPRSTIMNLFGVSLEYRKNIEHLRATCIILKESIANTIYYLSGISSRDQTRPAPVDLTLFRNAVMTAENFLSENNLLGKTIPSSKPEGVMTVLDTINQLNAQLKVYNTTFDLGVKEEIRRMLINGDRVLALEIHRIPKFLDKVISKTNEFLSKYN